MPLMAIMQKAEAHFDLQLPVALIKKEMIQDEKAAQAAAHADSQAATEVWQQQHNGQQPQHESDQSNASNSATPAPKQSPDVIVEQRLAKLEQQGILLKEGNNYRINVAYANGKLNVNGKPMPFPLPKMSR